MRRAGVVVVLGLLLLSGCTSTIGGFPAPTTAQTPPPSGTDSASGTRSALAAALSRVPATALGENGYVEFGNTARIRQLARSAPATWQPQLTAGAPALAGYATLAPEVIGVDLSAAATALTVGQAPRSMIVLAGGQQASTITAAATKSGWTGSGVLSKDLDLSKGPPATAAISLVASRIRPLGTDVVLSQQGGDPAGVAAANAVAASPADQVPAGRAATECLGDLPLAAGVGISAADPTALTAVGAGPGDGTKVSSVICLGAADTAAAEALAARARTALTTGRSRASRQSWTELLVSPDVEVLPRSPAMVRITAVTADPGLGLKMMLQRDIPGR